MGVQISQRNNTRNQMTVDFLLSHFCLFDNMFIPALYKNNLGVSAVLQGGQMVARDTSTPGQVIPAIGNVGSPALPVLSAITQTSTFSATTYFVYQTAVTVYGESTPSAEASQAITGTTQSINVAGTVVPGALSYKTYIGTSTGAEGHYVTSATPNVVITSPNGTAAGTAPTTDTTGNLANVIGFSISDGKVTLANAGTAPISVVKSGAIDANYILLPPNTTMDTVVGNKTLQDILNGIGFTMDRSGIDNTKIDN